MFLVGFGLLMKPSRLKMMIMTNEQKENIIIDYNNLIHSIICRYNIHGFTYEELYQEVITHLAFKLDNYDSSKSKLSTYITLVTKNKLNNLYTNKRNVQEIPLGGKEDVETYIEANYELSPIEVEALATMKENIDKHEHKEILNELINGHNQQDVADKYGYTREWVNRIWRGFVNEIKENVNE